MDWAEDEPATEVKDKDTTSVSWPPLMAQHSPGLYCTVVNISTSY